LRFSPKWKCYRARSYSAGQRKRKTAGKADGRSAVHIFAEFVFDGVGTSGVQVG